MTPADFRAALKALGITQRWFAERLGVGHVTVCRWASGNLAVPKYAEYVVELLRERKRPIGK